MTLYDVWYNYGSISPAIVRSVSFTFLGFYYFLCWNDKVFTLFSRLVVSPCKTAHSFAWWNVQAACLILHHQPCQRDRSVGPRGRTLSPWQTAQQPLRQKQQREPNQPAKPETEDVHRASLEQEGEMRRRLTSVTRGSQMRQSKRRRTIFSSALGFDLKVRAEL